MSEGQDSIRQELALAVQAQDRPRVQKIIEGMHAHDAADLVTQLDPVVRQAVVGSLYAETISSIIPWLEEGVREDVLHDLPQASAVQVVEELETDDALTLLSRLEQSEQQELLAAIDPKERLILEESLQYEENTAGRLMQRTLVAVPEHWSVGQVIDYLRDTSDAPDVFYDIFIVDPKHRPVGTLDLATLLKSRRPQAVSSLMKADFRTTTVATDREDVAWLFRHYGLVSLAVVDDAGRLAGVVLVDDIVDVIQEETEEDFLRLRGVGGPTGQRGVVQIVRRRFGWLAVNLLTAVLASYVISFFDQSISRLVALAVLMPIVASMGGNAGTQTLTVVIRGLATRTVTRNNARQVLWKEGLAGLFLGLSFAAITGGLTAVWFDDPGLGLVIGAAMVVNLLVANIAGAFIPLFLKRIRIDPAIASGVFLTTVTDVVGFFAFLGLATAVLL